ncbi:hypothetical protein DYB36_008294 [Aphanomyces astaci]|uniref:Peptidase M28 domain-containing protein n=2 Tax=Aphanomyces astaci TaxID=112090 RepID=A0A397BTE0_APHAT|nr:hypothetical protein DYB36_008294 [Aphanomyces astaci]
MNPANPRKHPLRTQFLASVVIFQFTESIFPVYAMKFTLLSAAAAIIFASTQNDGKRLIRLADDRAEWMTDDQVADLALRDIGFLDDTDGDWQHVFDLGAARQAQEIHVQGISPYPSVATYPQLVRALNAKIQTSDLKLSLESFVNQFKNRIYNTTEGKQSCGWIYDQVVKAAATTGNSNVNVTVRKFNHAWGQYSVIARVEPTTVTPKNDIVIVSAHQDSINWKDWKDPVKRDIAPGADDDGSGTVTILESLKYLLATPEWTPVRPVEFHWYSAEEWGLLGSKEIATEYATANKPVYAQMQQDMTGWVRPGTTPVVSLITDFTNKDLNTFLETLIKSYLDIPVSHSTCGYGCSDHFSWNKTGYPGSMPFETDSKDLNKNIHTSNDTLETIDYNHMAEFTKLANAYIVELTQDSATSC